METRLFSPVAFTLNVISVIRQGRPEAVVEQHVWITNPTVPPCGESFTEHFLNSKTVTIKDCVFDL